MREAEEIERAQEEAAWVQKSVVALAESKAKKLALSLLQSHIRHQSHTSSSHLGLIATYLGERTTMMSLC